MMDRPLIVNFMLVDKETRRKAMLYSCTTTFVDDDGTHYIVDAVGQKVGVKESGHVFNTKAQLWIASPDDSGGDDYETFIVGLVIDGPPEATVQDFHHWFRSLRWV